MRCAAEGVGSSVAGSSLTTEYACRQHVVEATTELHENARFGAKRSPRECPKCLKLSDFEQRTIAEATARKAVVIIGRKEVGHWRREQPAGKLQIPDPR